MTQSNIEDKPLLSTIFGTVTNFMPSFFSQKKCNCIRNTRKRFYTISATNHIGQINIGYRQILSHPYRPHLFNLKISSFRAHNRPYRSNQNGPQTNSAISISATGQIISAKLKSTSDKFDRICIGHTFNLKNPM